MYRRVTVACRSVTVLQTLQLTLRVEVDGSGRIDRPWRRSADVGRGLWAMPAAPPAFVGGLRDVLPGDLVGLVNDSAHNHFGIPAAARIDYPAGSFPAPRILDPTAKLRPGDTYVFTLEEMLSKSAGLPGFTTGAVADFLQVIGKAAAAGAVALVGLFPLAWDVPNGSPVTVPTPPPPTRVKRPRLPPGPPHVRLSFQGVFGTAAAAVEQWDWSLKTEVPSAPLDGPALVVRAQAMETAYVASIVALMMPQVVLTECIYAVTGADGKVLRFPDGAYQQGKIIVNHPGSNGANGHMPLQSALTVSLGTARPGATGRGRFFLPLQEPGQVLEDFRVSDGYCQAVANRSADLVRAMNALGSPVVINSSKGYNSPVTTIRVGRAPDTMRSRRESVKEGYLSAAVGA